MDKVTLLPCAHCGSDGLTARVDRAGRAFPQYRAFCRGCLMRTEDMAVRADAITAWNTRATPAPDSEKLREAVKQMEQYSVHVGYDNRGDFVWEDCISRAEVLAALGASA